MDKPVWILKEFQKYDDDSYTPERPLDVLYANRQFQELKKHINSFTEKEDYAELDKNFKRLWKDVSLIECLHYIEMNCLLENGQLPHAEAVGLVS